MLWQESREREGGGFCLLLAGGEDTAVGQLGWGLPHDQLLRDLCLSCEEENSPSAVGEES